MIMILTVLSAGIGYLLGSVSSSIFLSRLFFKNDIRNHGSGNAGATNMARTYGIKAGLVTLAGDMLKTFLACLIGRLIGGENACLAAAGGCLLGHCFPVIHHFMGGKGVSVGAALALVIDIRIFAIILAVFLAAAFASRKVSLGSCLAAAAMPIAAAMLGLPGEKIALAAFTAVVVLFCHRENIKRLISGTEPDFKAGGRHSKP